jgi:hypothetical protein
MKKILTNNEIYNLATVLGEAFKDENLYLPIKVNFYLQKNITTLTDLAKTIEESRMAIAQHYGEKNEDGTGFQIPTDKIEEASRELEDLFNLEQSVKIYTVSLEAFDEVKLSTKQMQAILFMVEDPTEEKEEKENND